MDLSAGAERLLSSKNLPKTHWVEEALRKMAQPGFGCVFITLKVVSDNGGVFR